MACCHHHTKITYFPCKNRVLRLLIFSLKQGIPGTSRRKLAPSSFNLEVSMLTSGVQYGDADQVCAGFQNIHPLSDSDQR